MVKKTLITITVLTVSVIVVVLVVLNSGNATVTVGGSAAPTTIQEANNEGVLGSNKNPVPGDPCILLKKATALVESVGLLKAPPIIQKDFINQCTFNGAQGEVTLLTGHAHGIATAWLSKPECKPEVIQAGVKACLINHSLHEGDKSPGAGIIIWSSQFDTIVFANGIPMSGLSLHAAATAIASELK